MAQADNDDLPAYTYVPGSGWPHPRSDPAGHSAGASLATAKPVEGDAWAASAAYRRGLRLFNAGFYWEAHEAWEALWHAHGRRGPTADALKGLIKLAAAGVKVRQGQPHGVVTHARRAAEAFESARAAGGNRRLGLDLPDLIERSRQMADWPPATDLPPAAPAAPIIPIQLEPG